MTRDSTAPPPAGAPPEAGQQTTETEIAPADEAGASPKPELAAPAPAAAEPEIDPAKLDPEALKVVLRLGQFDHQAYLVGGCVRDLLLGRQPKDFDVATSAHPGEVRALFRNCRLIGRRFRLAHVYFRGGKIIEVSTFRANPSEVEEVQAELELGEEGAAPSEVEEDLLITQDNVFGTTEQDARRRDFTINGLFYDVVAGKVIDYVNGRRDLNERLIRTIGDPEVRVREDPVRILRAVRFACKLAFDIESRTYAAMEGAVEDLPRCAPPRVLEETFRLIRGGVAEGSLKLLAALDALKLLLPPVHEYLQAGGADSERDLSRFAGALDRRVASGPPLDDGTLLAALLLPISRSAPAPDASQGGRPSLAHAIEEMLSELVRLARLPRRIAERCRTVLLMQSTLAGERRRRGGLAGFRRHPLFNEALTVFEVSVEATGQRREALEAWKAGQAPEPPPGGEGPKRRRRRRRRGRGGAGEAAHQLPSPPGRGPG
ncbi:MAG: polynucleotide adenylyltransferase PcnB [Myxococcales bacterium]|nr:polynucleotide adenylyltransferase PcnB [Myxococcales bacterium]